VDNPLTVVVEDGGGVCVWPVWLVRRLLSTCKSFLSSKKQTKGVCSTQLILIGPIDLGWLCVDTYPLSYNLRPDAFLNQVFRDLVAKQTNVLLIPNLLSLHISAPKNKEHSTKGHDHITTSTVYQISLRSGIVFCSAGHSRLFRHSGVLPRCCASRRLGPIL
jgi:hypothetical protein